jgi:hypothetical protein
MSKRILNIKNFHGGISESEKVGIAGAFYFGERLNIYDEPSKVKIMPKTTKVSGSTVTGLVKWIEDGKPWVDSKYFYDENGVIYKEDNLGSWSSLRSVTESDGQGMVIHNNGLFYARRKSIGYYGPLSGSPSFDDDWNEISDVTDFKFAPMKAFKEGFAVGHNNKLGWWDGSVWKSEKLSFPSGFKVISLDVVDEFLAIGCVRGNDFVKNDDGYIFFWDGTASTYNYFYQTDGPVNVVGNTKNRLISVIGMTGDIYLNANPFTSASTIPFVDIGTYARAYPGAITKWRGKTFIGFAGITDTADLYHGVYSWGSKSDKFAESLNYCFTISTGSKNGTTVAVGAVKGIGNDLYIGWKDGASYGVDKVSYNGEPYANASYESLIFDFDQLYSEKLAIKVKAVHLPLLDGESIQLGYKTNRASSYTMGTANSTVGSTETSISIPASDARFIEFQWKCVLSTTGSTSPTITYIGLLFDDMSQEKDY